jgi:hypothetical protein
MNKSSLHDPVLKDMFPRTITLGGSFINLIQVHCYLLGAEMWLEEYALFQGYLIFR